MINRPSQKAGAISDYRSNNFKASFTNDAILIFFFFMYSYRASRSVIGNLNEIETLFTSAGFLPAPGRAPPRFESLFMSRDFLKQLD